MSETLLERLRLHGSGAQADGLPGSSVRLFGDLLVEAASALDAKDAEISTLLSENDAQRFVMNTMRAENERLREALGFAVERLTAYGEPDGDPLMKMSRAALSKQETN